jgi:hypothetical protein
MFRGRPMRRDRGHELDLAEIGGETPGHTWCENSEAGAQPSGWARWGGLANALMLQRRCERDRTKRVAPERGRRRRGTPGPETGDRVWGYPIALSTRNLLEQQAMTESSKFHFVIFPT